VIYIDTDGIFTVDLARTGTTATSFTVELVRYVGETFSRTLTPTVSNNRFYTFQLSTYSVIPAGQYDLVIKDGSTEIFKEDALIQKTIIVYDVPNLQVNWNAPSMFPNVWILDTGIWNGEGIWTSTGIWKTT